MILCSPGIAVPGLFSPHRKMQLLRGGILGRRTKDGKKKGMDKNDIDTVTICDSDCRHTLHE